MLDMFCSTFVMVVLKLQASVKHTLSWPHWLTSISWQIAALDVVHLSWLFYSDLGFW